MSDQLKRVFDNYSLSARVKPVFFTVLPVVLSIFYRYPQTHTWTGGIITFLTTFGVITFFANQISTKGNFVQEKLYKGWGGAPTTIVLRFSDNTLDSYTKERYLRKLSELLEWPQIDSKEFEKSDPMGADEKYRAVTQYLREKTRDEKKFPLVIKELTNYGFSRNIFSVKKIGLVVSIVCLILNIFFVWYKDLDQTMTISFTKLMTIPFLSNALTVMLVVSIILWISMVTEKWVKLRGFSYAKALISITENL